VPCSRASCSTGPCSRPPVPRAPARGPLFEAPCSRVLLSRGHRCATWLGIDRSASRSRRPAGPGSLGRPYRSSNTNVDTEGRPSSWLFRKRKRSGKRPLSRSIGFPDPFCVFPRRTSAKNGQENRPGRTSPVFLTVFAWATKRGAHREPGGAASRGGRAAQALARRDALSTHLLRDGVGSTSVRRGWSGVRSPGHQPPPAVAPERRMKRRGGPLPSSAHLQTLPTASGSQHPPSNRCLGLVSPSNHSDVTRRPEPGQHDRHTPSVG
jgi:hypothetical protein